MEALLQQFEEEAAEAYDDRKPPPPPPHDGDGVENVDAVREALSNLASALRDAVPLLLQQQQQQRGRGELRTPTLNDSSAAAAVAGGDDSTVSARWLLDVCRQNHASSSSSSSDLLEPAFVAQAIVEASHKPDEASQQAALFDVVGLDSMELLSLVTPLLPQIRQNVTVQDIVNISTASPAAAAAGSSPTSDDAFIEDERRRQLLLAEALDAANVAAVARAELEELEARHRGLGGTTHSVVRASDARIRKDAEKAAERAKKALDRARHAGVILEDDDLLHIDRKSFSTGAGSATGTLGPGGLMNMSRDELAALQQTLLPEGARQYYDQRGLPVGTQRFTDSEGSDWVVIPAAKRDEATLPQRLRVEDVLGDDNPAAKAFAGTTSFNPMQSAVFEVAYKSRENMLVWYVRVFVWQSPKVGLTLFVMVWCGVMHDNLTLVRSFFFTTAPRQGQVKRTSPY